jgi:hypothetical protein
MRAILLRCPTCPGVRGLATDIGFDFNTFNPFQVVKVAPPIDCLVRPINVFCTIAIFFFYISEN